MALTSFASSKKLFLPFSSHILLHLMKKKDLSWQIKIIEENYWEKHTIQTSKTLEILTNKPYSSHSFNQFTAQEKTVDPGSYYSRSFYLNWVFDITRKNYNFAILLNDENVIKIVINVDRQKNADIYCCLFQKKIPNALEMKKTFQDQWKNKWFTEVNLFGKHFEWKV